MKFYVIFLITISVISVSGIFGGDKAEKGSWKWIVAFVHRYEENFFCSGSLISQKHVLSAAHCFQSKAEEKILSPAYVLALVGKHDLDIRNEPGTQKSLVWEIVLHPDWNFREEKFDADISLLALKDKIVLGDNIAVVGLPKISFKEVFGDGYVVGWGKSDEYRIHDNMPNQVILPAVNSSHCYTTSYKLAAASSNRLFCAGYENQGKAPCKGDSGAGFYLKDENSSWEVRGIVSVALYTFGYECDINIFTLFSNVARFVPWISSEVDRTKEVVWTFIEIDCHEYIDGIQPSVYSFNYTTECRFAYQGPKSRSSKLIPNFANHTTIKNAHAVTSFWTQLHGSSYIFADIGRTFPNLERFAFVYANLTHIERGDFSNMQNLKELDFTENPIRFIAEDVFWDLVNLEKLVIIISEIQKFPKYLFKNLRKLREMYIHYNKFSYLDKEIFANLHELRYLDASDNHRMTSIDQEIFWGLYKLEVLNLGTWRLKELPKLVFKNLFNLKILNLSGNQLSHLDHELFAATSKLQRVSFESNELKEIGIDFRKSQNIKFINLKGNECIDKLVHSVNGRSESIKELQNLINRQCITGV